MKRIGENIQQGKIVGILFLGERYYLVINNSVVSLLPADVVEGK